MAITYNDAQNILPDNQIPTGYVRPIIIIFTDFQWKQTIVLSILKATVDNSDKAVTMTNIFDDATIGIDKQVADILTNDYIASNTVDAFASLRILSSTTNPDDTSSEFLSDVPDSYTATVDIFVKVA